MNVGIMPTDGLCLLWVVVEGLTNAELQSYRQLRYKRLGENGMYMSSNVVLTLKRLCVSILYRKGGQGQPKKVGC
jgi:hypothetical protein